MVSQLGPGDGLSTIGTCCDAWLGPGDGLSTIGTCCDAWLGPGDGLSGGTMCCDAKIFSRKVQVRTSFLLCLRRLSPYC